MNWYLWLLISLFSPVIHASTEVLAGPHWWRDRGELPSSSSLYSLGGGEAWWKGQAFFSGSVIVPSCVISMDNKWQTVSLRDSNDTALDQAGGIDGTKLKLQLHDCDLVNTIGSNATGSRIKLMFYRMSRNDNSDQNLNGVDFKVTDEKGNTSSAGQYIPGSQLYGPDASLNYRLHFVNDDSNSNPKNTVTLGILVHQE